MILTNEHRQSFPSHVVHANGHELVTVARRFGTLALARRICSHPATQTHLIPGDAILPAHNGIITPGRQEWTCLLPQEVPFASVTRLLGWQTHDVDLLTDTTIPSLAHTYDQIIRQVEQVDVARLVTRDASRAWT